MGTGIKADAHQLVEALPDESTWDDLARIIQERLAVERGLADVEAGRTMTTEELRRRFAPKA
jgi:predicted transcriptional regulator